MTPIVYLVVAGLEALLSGTITGVMSVLDGPPNKQNEEMLTAI